MKFEKFSLIFFKNEEKIYENTYKTFKFENNKLEFLMLDYNTQIDLQQKLFMRENEDFQFVLDISNEKCTIHLKKEELTLDIPVDYCELKELHNQIILEYIIESDDAKNKLIIMKEEC